MGLKPMIIAAKIGVWQDLNQSSEFPSIEELQKMPKTVKTVYQGYNTLDNRNINYYTLNEKEAKSYGKNVRKVDINTSEHLSANSKTFSDLKKEYYRNTGVI